MMVGSTASAHMEGINAEAQNLNSLWEMCYQQNLSYPDEEHLSKILAHS